MSNYEFTGVERADRQTPDSETTMSRTTEVQGSPRTDHRFVAEAITEEALKIFPMERV